MRRRHGPVRTRGAEAETGPHSCSSRKGVCLLGSREALWPRARHPSFQLSLGPPGCVSCTGPLPTLASPPRRGGLGWPISRPLPSPHLLPLPPSFLQTLHNLASSVPSPSLSPGATPTAGARTASVSSPLGPSWCPPPRLPGLSSSAAAPHPTPLPALPPEQALSRAGGRALGCPLPSLCPLLPKFILSQPVTPPKGVQEGFQGLGHPDGVSPCLPADILQEILLKEQELLQPGILGDEEDVETEGHRAERDSLLSTSSAALHDSTLSLASSQASGPSLSHQLLSSFVSGLSDGVDSGYVEDSQDGSFEWPKRPGSQERRAHRRPGQFNRIYKLFKSTSQLVLRRDSRTPEGGPDSAPSLRRAGSLCSPCSPLAGPAQPPSRAQRSRSLPQHKLGSQLPGWALAPASRHQRRCPFLSGDEDPGASTLRVVVFGSDRISGKVARAYSKLR